MSGLTTSGLVLANGGETLNVATGASTFTLATQLLPGSTYAITVAQQPAGLTCSVASGSGAMGSANVANAVVTCATSAYQLGGTVSGLTTSGLVLANGSDTVTVAPGASTFTMPTAVASGSSYAINVQAQPTGAACSVSAGSGTMGTADVSGVTVTCSAQPHSLGGSIAGLSESGLVLANGSDTLAVSSGASSFTMPATLAYGASYAITIQTQPSGADCGVANGAGTMGATDIASVAVTCAAHSHRLSGTVAGLSAAGLVLANGSDALAVTSGASSFQMPANVAEGGSYAVAVQTQPAGLTCSVAGGNGTMGTADVNGIAVTCAPATHTLGGSIAGVPASGVVLANGSDTLAVAANATVFSMPAAVVEGAGYAVTLQSQPAGLSCSVANGSGTVGTGDVTSVAVTCIPTLGGTITGMDLAGLVLANGSDTLGIAANASSFTMPVSVIAGNAYALTVQSQPANRACSISNGSGTMTSSGVTNVAIACVPVAQITTIAGTALTTGSTDATGAAASFSHPFGVVVNSAGDYFVGDLNNNEVRKITPAGVVTTFAGSTTHGTADGTGTAAAFYGPSGLAIDSSDNIYVVDRLNYLIRKITPAGVVSTLAGTAGSPGSSNGTGTAASFSSIYGLAVDSTGNVYVADMSNNQIRKITPAGVVTTFAGSSTPGSADGPALSATFTSPAGIAVGPDDSIYVSETGNHRIRKITQAGVVTTIAGAGTAGNTDGTGSAAKFNQPYGLVIAPDDTIYVADTIGNKIRKVTQAGVVTTIIGPLNLATSGHADGYGNAATIYLPTGLAFDASGNLIMCDYNNNTIRKIVLQ